MSLEKQMDKLDLSDNATKTDDIKDKRKEEMTAAIEKLKIVRKRVKEAVKETGSLETKKLDELHSIISNATTKEVNMMLKHTSTILNFGDKLTIKGLDD